MGRFLHFDSVRCAAPFFFLFLSLSLLLEREGGGGDDLVEKFRFARNGLRAQLSSFRRGPQQRPRLFAFGIFSDRTFSRAPESHRHEAGCRSLSLST
jgi:hypothetical protein